MRRERTWVEISAAALRRNLSHIQRLIGPGVRIMPIVKANAYGHGLLPVLSALRGRRYWGLGVAHGDEALAIRDTGYHGRLVALSSWQSSELTPLIRQDVELAVWDYSSFRAVQAVHTHTARSPKVHLKLDTGTTRIGFRTEDLPMLQQLLRRTTFSVVGIYSHFANAEAASVRPTIRQLSRFTTLSQRLHLQRGVERHIACTAAILRLPEARFGLVRLGIGLYGLWPSPETKSALKASHPAFQLTPVLTWKTKLVQAKRVPTGTAVGYGSTFRAKRPMLVGVVPVGYADGYDRHGSNRAWVMIRGRRAPVIGRVCMNLMMVDLSRVPNAKAGLEVTLIGDGVSADDIADCTGTINYTVTTMINASIPRHLVS